PRGGLSVFTSANVRYWPKADMSYCSAHVCFGAKADIDQPPFTTAVITAWRETLDERDRRGLKHPLSNVRRWRQSLMPKAKPDAVTKAETAWRRFLASMKALPPDQAEPLRQQAMATLS